MNPEERLRDILPEPDAYGRYADEQRYAAAQHLRRQSMLRRLRMVLAAGLAAFCLVTWLLVRNDGALGWFAFSAPARVVRQHLEALSRGQTREAYSFFSRKYRGEIPLRAYEQLVNSHRAMFRTHVLSVASPSRSDDVAVLDFSLQASSGTLYLARFTLVRNDDQWWIDQIRWSEAPNPRGFTRV